VLAAACDNGTKPAAPDLASAPAKMMDLAMSAAKADAGDTAAPAEVLDDGKILGILHAANQGEIEQARLAQTRAVDKRVLAFAKMMMKDHTNADQKGEKLGKDRKIVPADSAIEKHIQSDVKLTMAKLSAALAPDFDKEYVDAQVKGHHDVLMLLRDQLRPNATDAKLRELLDTITPTVQHHYDEALKLQKSGTKIVVPK
jgi:putative membrane protein